MRSRNEILDDFKGESGQFGHSPRTMEVLLDIRDLLIKQSKIKGK